ncbi:dexamethasone-induced Ras-related protein 1-like [Paramacrobiotus metropolitanus]|uniref:dexamethasone-induced Ras-related protein 1-like n=1 Tax=Paramacrobiotus metropolitanus TaxID=2943436 RepID=UPI0024461567|nr:dexamethasone-induced Ras-related protein 1-like [Paramacrobiotus metropolitanus]
MSDLLTELQCTQPPPCNCYRLIILGSAKVGKTAIVKRFLHNEYTDIYTPTIEDFHRKIYKIRGEAFQLDILDTSGIHPFPAMRRLSFLTGDAFILVYSVDSRESFEEVLRLREQIVESIRSAASTNSKIKPKHLPIPMIIAGNKSDRERERVVPAGEVAHALQRIKDHVPCMECSAKENSNISDVFSTLFALADFPEEMIPNAARRISLTHGGNVLPRRTYAGKGSARRRHGLSLRRRLSDAYSALILNVRRPSIATDLVMVRTKTEQNGLQRSKSRRRGRSSVKKTDSQRSANVVPKDKTNVEQLAGTRNPKYPKKEKASCCIL